MYHIISYYIIVYYIIPGYITLYQCIYAYIEVGQGGVELLLGALEVLLLHGQRLGRVLLLGGLVLNVRGLGLCLVYLNECLLCVVCY